MANTVYIVEEIGAVVQKVDAALYSSIGSNIYYMYGHPLEIVKRLQELSNSITQKDKKFPLVILFTDIRIDRETPGFYGSTSLRILVANITQPEYISEQRTELNFKPVIHPIKEELIKQIERHYQFTFPENITFSETDMYFYGSSINNKNIFNDYIDATEIRDLKINIKNKIC
jgi:hypothetical protein